MSHTPKALPALILSLCFTAAAQAGTVDLTDATIADLDAAFSKGTLTSEKLVKMYLKRIEAYDKKGPGINAVITLNPKALEQARALDKERKTYVHLVRGELEVNGQKLSGGDAAKLEGESQLRLAAGKDAEVLVFDLQA